MVPTAVSLAHFMSNCKAPLEPWVENDAGKCLGIALPTASIHAVIFRGPVSVTLFAEGLVYPLPFSPLLHCGIRLVSRRMNGYLVFVPTDVLSLLPTVSAPAAGGLGA